MKVRCTLNKYCDNGTRLMESVWSNDPNEMSKYLEDNINAQTDNGYTALMIATVNNKRKAVEFLLENGADPNIKNERGKTALLLLGEMILGDGERLDTDIIRLLLEHGADPNIQDKHGRTPLMFEYNYKISEYVIKLLLEHGADPNIQDEHGRTPLLAHEDIKAIKLLLDYGANPNIQDKNGETVLMLTYAEDTLQLLLEHGADPNIKNNKGETKIIFKDMSPYDELVELLLEYGATYNVEKVLKRKLYNVLTIHIELLKKENKLLLESLEECEDRPGGANFQKVADTYKNHPYFKS